MLWSSTFLFRKVQCSLISGVSFQILLLLWPATRCSVLSPPPLDSLHLVQTTPSIFAQCYLQYLSHHRVQSVEEPSAAMKEFHPAPSRPCSPSTEALCDTQFGQPWLLASGWQSTSTGLIALGMPRSHGHTGCSTILRNPDIGLQLGARASTLVSTSALLLEISSI